MTLPTNYMYQIRRTLILATLCIAFLNPAFTQAPTIDVQHYDLTLDPDIDRGVVTGAVQIRFKVPATERSAAFNCGNLQIHSVEGSSVSSYEKVGSKLIVQLLETVATEHEVTVNYAGAPARGLLFNAPAGQAHTVYFTSEWMVCHEDPSDKATLNLNLLVPPGRDCIASGELVRSQPQGDKIRFQWEQRYATPAYTYGFVIGAFNKATEQIDGITFNYYSSSLNESDLKQVFLETADILQFFQEKSGVKYVQKAYSQVLIGSNYQEMSGLAVFNKSYAAAVLRDSSEIHLTGHELAHQWWGNMITCKDFSHFWLNEAFAVYMATAFHERRFGRKKYLADVALYKGIYDNLVKAGKDKALIIPQWQPTRDNRHVVYYKGAYVLHLLREHLGEDSFWRGIRYYSQQYYGKSVVTDDFKLAMEQVTNTDLDDFFEEWVYRAAK